MKKLGLALGSGGARGIAHIGFLKALEENSITPDYISGCSMGSVVGALYSMGMTPDQMIKDALKLTKRDLFDISVQSLMKRSLMRSEKIRTVLSKYFKGITFDQLNIPFCCVGTDIKTGKKVTFDRGDVTNCVIASSAIPLIFAPIEIGDYLVADGGIVCRNPIDEVRKMGADVVICVDVLDKISAIDNVNNLKDYAFRLIKIYDNCITQLSLESIKPDLLIIPELGDISEFRLENIKFSYEKGYEIAMKNMDKIKTIIA